MAKKRHNFLVLTQLSNGNVLSGASRTWFLLRSGSNQNSEALNQGHRAACGSTSPRYFCTRTSFQNSHRKKRVRNAMFSSRGKELMRFWTSCSSSNVLGTITETCKLNVVICRGMKVLVGGGTGFIGRGLKSALRSKGHEVILISRSKGPGKLTWDEITKSGLPECQAVVNLAGENILNPLRRWDEKYKEDVMKSRVDSTRLLAEKISQSNQPPEVFVSSSAVGFYPVSETEDYDEDTPLRDVDYITHLCSAWEASAQLPEGCTTRHVVTRIGVVLGRDGGVIQQAYWPFYFGVGGVIGSGHQYFPWIHIQDMCGIIIHAIENKHVTGVLNAVGPEITTNRDFTKHLAGSLWRPAIFPMPSFVVNTVFSSERGTMLLQGQKVHPKRTLESGYRFKFPDLKSAVENAIK